MRHLFFLTCWLASFVASIGCGQEVDFNQHIRPILNQHCVACHGGVKQASDLSFVYEDQAMSVIEPGDPDNSLLMERVLADDDDERMPPLEHGRGLNAVEKRYLSDWISQGAKWRKHWAYEPPQTSDPKRLNESDWPRNKIDKFVLAKLQENGLEPNPDTQPERWLRKVSLDVIGLAPTRAQTQLFMKAVESQGETAYAEKVETLLNSPAFGERWGSVWLDAVRYADSHGLGIDGRRSVWKYRDWVIRAFNDDMPYDQFTIRQLAGDLLAEPAMDDLLATACHRLTQSNEEGGTDDEMFRVEAVIDRVNTTWQVWQGLSFGCTQCHSHPYEPIRHEEYYQFMAFFNNTVDCDLSDDAPNLAVPLDETEFDSAIELDRQIQALTEAQWKSSSLIVSDESKWRPLPAANIKTNNQTIATNVETEPLLEFATHGTVARDTTFEIDAELPEGLNCLTAIRFIGMPVDRVQALKDSEWGFVLSHITAKLVATDGTSRELKFQAVMADEPNPLVDPQESLNENSPWGFAAYSRINYPRSAAFVLEAPAEILAGERLDVSLRFGVQALGTFPLVVHRFRMDVSESSQLTDWYANEKTIDRAAKLKELAAKRSAIKSINIPMMAERIEVFARPTHVFERGNYLAKGDRVAAKLPDFLARSQVSVAERKQTRLELARWIASGQNPLTARVIVNRIWGEVFGIGIVETQEDFGSSGTAPSNQALLDDLAARFQTEMKWSLKTLIGEIVMSSSYRQSTNMSAAKLEQDPRNRLISRGPRVRLPAETIRDQALAVSGLLSLKQFGPPVFPPLPDGVWRPFDGGDKWVSPAVGDSERYRRSIYTYTKRSIPYPVVATFDAPSREFCAVRRLPSNTPLQALMTLNDASFVEAAEALGLRMATADGELSDKLRFGFSLAACREPTKVEIDSLLKLYQKSAAVDESVAFTNVANVLLNLDEVLSK